MVYYPMAYAQFTSFVPNCSLNQHLNVGSGSNGSAGNTHEYRSYLQKNATKLMGELRDCAGKDNKGDCKICPVCNKALVYKPDGNMPSTIGVSNVTTNVNPYNQDPRL